MKILCSAAAIMALSPSPFALHSCIPLISLNVCDSLAHILVSGVLLLVDIWCQSGLFARRVVAIFGGVLLTFGANRLGATSDSRAVGEVQDLRASLGQLSERASQYTTDACLRRYLRARSWNVKRAEKMLRESLEWRATYKPEEIRWEDVAKESETGKVYRAAVVDKQGHTVLVMRPAQQNTTSREGQIKQLVYSMENAILNLPPGQEEMVWLVDFKNWSMNKAIPIKLTQETAYVLQRHYPERLGIGILYNPPHIFETFWQIVKPFLDPRTARKVKFVYSSDHVSMSHVNALFDMDQLEDLLKDDNFNLEEYSRRMCQDDAKFGLERKTTNTNL